MNKYWKQAISACIFSIIGICVMDALYLGPENVQWGLNLLVGLVASSVVMVVVIIISKK